MSKLWSFYRQDSGLFTGVQFRASDEKQLTANTPDGCAAIEGQYNQARQRMDLTTGEIVFHQPAPPVDDEWQTWSWSEQRGAWLSSPTDAAVGRSARRLRGALLAECDWVTLRASDTGEAVPQEWSAYREALRSVPAQPGFPREIDWPVAPRRA